jgi:hypothetical protein
MMHVNHPYQCGYFIDKKQQEEMKWNLLVSII